MQSATTVGKEELKRVLEISDHDKEWYKFFKGELSVVTLPKLLACKGPRLATAGA